MRIGRANGEGWLRLGEAAAELGVSLNTLRRWSDSGKLTCYRSPGGHRRYRRGDIEALLRAEDTTARSRPPTPRRAKPAPPVAGELRAPLLALARVAAEGVGVTECRISLRRPTTPSPSSPHAAARAAAQRLRTRARRRARCRPSARCCAPAGGSSSPTWAPPISSSDPRRRRSASAATPPILAVPLAVDGRNSAVLELVESRAPRAFTGANVTFAEFMARQAARLLSRRGGDGRA